MLSSVCVLTSLIYPSAPRRERNGIYPDVLGPFVMNGILGELDAPSVVLEDGQGLLAFVLLLSEFAVRLDADVLVAQVVADADEPDGFFGCLTCRLVLSLAAGEGNAALERGRPADGAAAGVEDVARARAAPVEVASVV